MESMVTPPFASVVDDVYNDRRCFHFTVGWWYSKCPLSCTQDCVSAPPSAGVTPVVPNVYAKMMNLSVTRRSLRDGIVGC